MLGHPRCDLRPRPEPELAQDVLDMAFGGALTDDQVVRDFSVCESSCNKGGDLVLAAAEQRRDRTIHRWFPLRGFSLKADGHRGCSVQRAAAGKDAFMARRTQPLDESL